jgi:hypothetical protein
VLVNGSEQRRLPLRVVAMTDAGPEASAPERRFDA